MTAPTELMKGNAQALVLACLAREEMHGYRIAKELKEWSEGYFALGEGTLYPLLHQMEKDGLIEGYWVTVSGGRERKCYRITDHGTSELARKRDQWREFQSNVNRVLGLAPDMQTA